MRTFLDSILAFIGSESLTDSELTIMAENLEGVSSYSLEVYLALRLLLEDRESVSTQLDKLKSFFILKGLDLASVPSTVSTSNIFLGSPL